MAFGVLVSRVTGGPLDDHLTEDLFVPLGMVDTGFWVPGDQSGRLPAAYRHTDEGLLETEPAGGGPYSGPPRMDVSYGELVSTARDYARFLGLLANGGRLDTRQLLSAEDVRQLRRARCRRRRRARTASSPASGTAPAGGSASPCRPRAPTRAAGAGPADRAPTSSTRTARWACCSPRWSSGRGPGPLLAEFQEASPSA